MIVAGSIVGSGELIATTKTGAEAGFALLWLIILGCVIKVFVQVEFGRYTITSGKTALDGLNEIPGPAVRFRAWGQPRSINWLMVYWLLMTLASLAQLGGIVGAVGQAMQISVPLTQQGREYNAFAKTQAEIQIEETLARLARERNDQTALNQAENKLKELEANQSEISAQYLALRRSVQANQALLNESPDKGKSDRLKQQIANAQSAMEELKTSIVSIDDKLWAGIIAVITSLLLYIGRYHFIQHFSTILVATFTLVTIGNLFALQFSPDWAVSGSEVLKGLSFTLPGNTVAGATPVVTALATFGIIGVGASELITYPYWCVERGYARFTGPWEESDRWAHRAAGWMKVMQLDAWGSMLVYTFATIAFYLLGAAILGRAGMNPEKSELIRTLSVMYEPVFGAIAPTLFLFGAFAVLYSTFFVANAGHARVDADGIRLFGVIPPSAKSLHNTVTVFNIAFPLLCFVVYALIPEPARLVLLSGVMQAIMLPMLSFAALYYRYRRIDKRLAPGRLWDVGLWLSSLGMLIAGGYLFYAQLPKLAGMLGLE
ncbi:transmembrane Mn(2+) transporter [Blastopirellula marina]|uniref:Transmembrane Mn(2+) transporter n=1 Tax=Blastopirellula marina TaxID=124 RepID=A0A2S8G323_9BACT|nr:transmembrane Mn(2+) transporter [Blastopirellula marina]PTL45319.1 transmembrane Mn(2+) transporter [Blastopirellula marina]